jgi:hypothetical protein
MDFDFNSVPSLPLPRNFAFTGYLINTNGLKETNIISGLNNESHIKANKLKALADVIYTNNVNIAHIVETHNYSPSNESSLNSSAVINSKPDTGSKGGTANIHVRHESIEDYNSINMSASKILINDQPVWLITAYFPPKCKEARSTICNVEYFIQKRPGQRMILAADFNSLEDDSYLNSGGTLAEYKTNSKDASINSFLNKWCFRDLFNKKHVTSNKEEHLTHWNWEYTRGKRIDRVYMNFEVLGEVVVSTIDHPWTDHKGVLYSFKSIDKMEPSQQEWVSIPKIALKVDRVVKALEPLVSKYIPFESQKLPNIVTKWDKMKKKALKIAHHEWKMHKKQKGNERRKAKREYIKSLHRLQVTDVSHPLREVFKELTLIKRDKWFIKLEESIWVSQKMKEEKEILYNGKTNKEFFKKEALTRKTIANMSVSDNPNDPKAPRTNDTKVIQDNFIKYYTELYKDKTIDMDVLNELLENMNLKLTEAHRESLGSRITATEVLKVLTWLPDTSPGRDGIPYAFWNLSPIDSANRLAKLANVLAANKSIPESMRQVIITTIPKVEDPYHTGLYRPISLLNTDYKIIARVWANRLGPILADIIGHHQRGFVPGRDGRENILNVQLIHDTMSWENLDGIFLFLDQEKAFDRVSHKTLNKVFKKFKWPKRFRKTVANMYKEDTTFASIITNGVLSDSTAPLNSGTRQGCPLSPLLFAIIADIFNQNIINNERFTGHYVGGRTTISAYADDTVVHIANQEDITIALTTLNKANAATGGKTNYGKSEAILTGYWKANPPTIPITITKCTKYLGMQVGDNSSQLEIMWKNIQTKIGKELRYWNTRCSSSIIDRVLIVKTMALSKIWYHASIVAPPITVINSIEKACVSFIWREGPSKISLKQLRLPKKEGGFNFWNLKAKIAAFHNIWIAKYIKNELNPILSNTIKYWTSKYQDATGMDICLWDSVNDHSINIVKTTGSRNMSAFQLAWANIIHRKPILQANNWVVYSNSEEAGMEYKDKTYNAMCKVAEVGDKSISVRWWDRYGPHYKRLHSSEGNNFWHLPIHKTYRVILTNNNPSVRIAKPEDLYIKTSKVKLAINDPMLWEAKPLKLDKFSPVFMKKYFNTYFYEAQLANTETLTKKINKWEVKYKINCLEAINSSFKSIVSSKIKGFIWLLLNHALPVKGRWFGEDKHLCSLCDQEETIKHALWNCNLGKKVMKVIVKECKYRDLNPALLNHFANVFKVWKNDINDICCQAITYIVMYQTWLTRNHLAFKDESLFLCPKRLANRCWNILETCIKAKIIELEIKKQWWTHQFEVLNIDEEKYLLNKGVIETAIKEYLKIMHPTMDSVWRDNEIDLTEDPFVNQQDFIIISPSQNDAKMDSRWRLLSTSPPPIEGE